MPCLPANPAHSSPTPPDIGNRGCHHHGLRPQPTSSSSSLPATYSLPILLPPPPPPPPQQLSNAHKPTTVHNHPCAAPSCSAAAKVADELQLLADVALVRAVAANLSLDTSQLGVRGSEGRQVRYRVSGVCGVRVGGWVGAQSVGSQCRDGWGAWGAVCAYTAAAVTVAVTVTAATWWAGSWCSFMHPNKGSVVVAFALTAQGPNLIPPKRTHPSPCFCVRVSVLIHARLRLNPHTNTSSPPHLSPPTPLPLPRLC